MKLNLGCGNDIQEGYLNVDFQAFAGVDLLADVRRLPFCPESCEEIFAYDLIEHFSWREVHSLLSHWYQVLKIGGTLRLRTPDLGGLVKLYRTRPVGWSPQDGRTKGVDPVVERIFGGQDHCGNFHYVIFDRQSIREILTEIGFQIEEVCPDGEDISNLCVTARKTSAEKKNDQVEDLDNEDHVWLGKIAADLRVTWEGPVFGPSGYAFASRGHLKGLDNLGVQLRIQPLLGDCKIATEGCEALAPEWKQVDGYFGDVRRRFALNSPVAEETFQRLVHLTNRPKGGVYVCSHVPTDAAGHDFFADFRRLNPGLDAYVGYTMFETDGIPGSWIRACNQMDEIWVPTRFNVETFARAGVDRSKLRVVPIGFDPEYYLPEECQPLFMDPEGRFCFLSIFEWTYRKGWDVLIRAFLEEFDGNEQVKLVLRAYQGGGVLGKDVLPVADQLKRYISELGFDSKEIPPIELIEHMIPASQMPSFYRSGDAFVLPTRGEGWGIPLTEALLLEVPVIATGWGGQTEFLNDQNAYLIGIEGLVPVQEAQIRDNELYRAQMWAEPSLGDTRRQLRRVFENRSEAREKARIGREQIIQKFTVQKVTARLMKRLDRLANHRWSLDHRDPVGKEAGASKKSKKAAARKMKERTPTAKFRQHQPLRVLFQARPDVFSLPGGDSEVLVQYKKQLTAMGMEIDISSYDEIDLTDYDLVHIFNLGAQFAINAARQKTPFVCTPLFEDKPRYLVRSLATVRGFQELLSGGDKEIFKRILAGYEGEPATRELPDTRFLIERAGALLVSGQDEGERLQGDYPNAGRVELVRFGFNRPDENVCSGALFESEFGVKDFILCVGRLETRKNQLMLLHALAEEDVPVVFVNGQTVQPDYELLCHRFGRKGQTVYTGRLAREMLFSAYAAAKVHALPSWYELPGLVTLEAAWSGCRIVASDWGTLPDYLGDAFYNCRPDDPDTIRDAVLEALSAPRTESVRDSLATMTWQKSAAEVAAIYGRVLAASDSAQGRARAAESGEVAEREQTFRRLRMKIQANLVRDPKRILGTVNNLLKFRPDDPILHFVKGSACLKTGDLEGAEAHFRSAVEMWPGIDVQVYLYLSMLLKKKGDHAGALWYLHEASTVMPFLSNESRSLVQEYGAASFGLLSPQDRAAFQSRGFCPAQPLSV